MKTTKRLLVLLLAVLMLASSLLVGCKKEEPPVVENPNTPSGDTPTDTFETDEWGQRIYPTGIPDSLDYGGDTIDILVRNKGGDIRQYEWFSKDFANDTLKTEIYYRNLDIEDNLGVTLNFPTRSDDEMNAFITENFSAGLGGVDIISPYQYFGTSTEVMECYKNLLGDELTYMHLDHPYWNQNFMKAAQANNKLFIALGDMNLSAYMTTFSMYFNKKLLGEMCGGMTDEELYTIVTEGDWTWDKMVELCQNTYTDFDEITGKSEGDKYGFTSHYNVHAYDGMLAAFDMDLTALNADGTHTFKSDRSSLEALGAAGNKLVDFYRSQNAFLVGHGIKDYTQPVANFKQGLSMFCIAGVGDSNHLTQMTDEYGLLPLPKYSTDQENYYGGVQDSHNCVAVMYHDGQDYAQTSAVLELFASISYSTVRPVLCETVLKAKNLKDTTAWQVFDLIISGARWDFTDIYPSAFGGVSASPRNGLWRDALRKAVYGEGQGEGYIATAVRDNKQAITEKLAALDKWLATHD